MVKRYTEPVARTLSQIADRLDKLRAEERELRRAQRAGIRSMRAAGATIDTIQAAARVSRPTVIASIRRAD